MWRRAALFDSTSLNFPDIRERDLELFERNEILGDVASAKQQVNTQRNQIAIELDASKLLLNVLCQFAIWMSCMV